MLKNIHQSDFISLYVCIFARGNCSTVGMNTDVRFTVRGLRKQGPNVRKQAVQTCCKQACAVLFLQ